MPRLTMEAKEKLSLNMTKKARKNLEKLRDKLEADSLTETVRRSLAIADMVVSEIRKGHEVFVVTAEGEKKEIKIS